MSDIQAQFTMDSVNRILLNFAKNKVMKVIITTDDISIPDLEIPLDVAKYLNKGDRICIDVEGHKNPVFLIIEYKEYVCSKKMFNDDRLIVNCILDDRYDTM